MTSLKKARGMALLASITATAMLAGCGGASKTPAANEPGGGSDDVMKEKFTIELMAPANAGGGWADNNHPVLQALNKKLNIELKVTWVPNANYNEKLNVLAASNSMPDVYFVKSDDYQKWLDKDVFMNVTDAYAKMPNLKKYLPEQEMQFSNPKGKYYGFPFYQNEVLDTLVIRNDWLAKLNLKAPDTINDFYQVAKAFADQDPDGNGKKDTIGFTMNASPDSNLPFGDVDYLSGAFGLANGWKLENGKLVPWQTQTKELTDFVTFLRKAYAEGVLDKDFPVLKGQETLKKFEANKVGFGFANGSRLNEVSIPPLKKLAPNADVVQLIPPAGTDGKRVTKTRASGLNKIVVNAKIDKNKQQRILQLLDYMLSDEGNDLVKNGVENVDWKKTGTDTYEKLPAFDTNRSDILMGWFFKRYDPYFLVYKWADPKDRKQMEQFFETSKKYIQRDESNAITSETALKSGTNLDLKLREAMTKIVTEQDPVEKLADAIKAWRSGGGDQIIAETNEQYAKLK